MRSRRRSKRSVVLEREYRKSATQQRNDVTQGRVKGPLS